MRRNHTGAACPPHGPAWRARVQEFGWDARCVRRVVEGSCGEDDAGAGPDLDLLHTEARWDRRVRRLIG